MAGERRGKASAGSFGPSLLFTAAAVLPLSHCHKIVFSIERFALEILIVVASQSPTSPSGLRLVSESVPSADADLVAALQAENDRHAARTSELLRAIAARAGAPRGVPFAERQDSKKGAARELNMSEQQLTRLLVRYHAAYPNRPKLAVQPAGLKSSRWIVYTDRVRSIIESGEPY